MNSGQVRTELQMLTGIMSEDITYLYYALMKQSQPHNVINNKVLYEVNEHEIKLDISLTDVEAWLAKMEDFNG